MVGSETSACVAFIKRERLWSEILEWGCDELYVSWRDSIAVWRVVGSRPVIWMEWFLVLAKAWAIARPMPREPPVIRTWISGEADAAGFGDSVDKFCECIFLGTEIAMENGQNDGGEKTRGRRMVERLLCPV